MPETLIQKPNVRISKKESVAAFLALVAVAGALGITAKRGTSADKAFYTDIPVPAANQPHINYIAKYGDSESSIAARFNTHYDGTDYENMINIQLPKYEQKKRDIHPGDQLRLPSK
ncbi:MAG TPA: hypothetical protein VHD84_01380 [Candidatus Saccharimonadales bacterium]|nr:hypothetical protein [Candidatus Saccharimonadales bacterium]